MNRFALIFTNIFTNLSRCIIINKVLVNKCDSTQDLRYITIPCCSIYRLRQHICWLYSRAHSFSGILFYDTDALAGYTFMLANVFDREYNT